MVLKVVMYFLLSLPVAMSMAIAAPMPLAATNTWSGSIADEALVKEMPDHGVITEGASLERLAKAWGFTDDDSLVDFSKEIVIVATTKGSTLRLSASLADDGDVTALGAASRDFAPGFRYVVMSVPRSGIKTVNRRELPRSSAKAGSDDPERLSRIVANLDALHRVTDTPHPMADSTAALCRLVFNTNIHEGSSSTPAYCHVYVTADAKQPMASGKGSYPVGSVIVKAKLEWQKSLAPVLYTVMRKMDEGYDRGHGDWEYAVLDGPSSRVLARGRIDSCIDCHAAYAATDHVTRLYMKPR
ncbi:MAG: cytochrome P460 family protein [Planctomycetia bacterium]